MILRNGVLKITYHTKKILNKELSKDDTFFIFSKFFKFYLRTLKDFKDRVRVYNSMTDKELEIFWKY